MTAPDPLSEPPPPSFSFRVLQAAVYGMGVLLFVGIIALGFTLWRKSTAPEAEVATTVAPPFGMAAPAAALLPFDDRLLPLPADARVLDMAIDGSTLMLRLEIVQAGRPAGGREQMLWLYDMAQQEMIGSYLLPGGEARND